jgi:hypothetical protein
MAKEMEYDGVVLYCSDPDPEKANLWKDIKRDLIPENERWVPIGLLGAPVALAHPAFLPVDFACIMGQIEFAQTHKHFRRKAFMVVSHDCGYYERIMPLARRDFTIGDKMADVATGLVLIKSRFQVAIVKGFFKRPEHPGFEEIH